MIKVTLQRESGKPTCGSIKPAAAPELLVNTIQLFPDGTAIVQERTCLKPGEQAALWVGSQQYLTVHEAP